MLRYSLCASPLAAYELRCSLSLTAQLVSCLGVPYAPQPIPWLGIGILWPIRRNVVGSDLRHDSRQWLWVLILALFRSSGPPIAFNGGLFGWHNATPYTMGA